jgi:hypothetical protein
VNRSGLENVELEGDVDAVQVSLVGLNEVDNVTLCLGKANSNVKCIDLEKLNVSLFVQNVSFRFLFIWMFWISALSTTPRRFS